tara:strand:- start:225 stop:788 length:564 start_codon:yes stop_codon:yes gene_type:complete
MNNQKLIIYNFEPLFNILSEIEDNLNFKIIKLEEKNLKKSFINDKQKSIFLTKKKIDDLDNQFLLDKFPIKINDLIEKLNIEFLRLNFKGQSNHIIGLYSVDLNSKNISKNEEYLKLTEKEVETIIYLSSSKKPISIKELQSQVWDHKSTLETHTVETHIHRLRKKIKDKFGDENFIISTKSGYLIK